MNQYRLPSAKWIIALLALSMPGSQQLFAQTSSVDSVSSAPSIEEQDVPPAVPVEEQPEVLSRGPVHEAFAEPVTMEPQTGLIAPQQPPPDIEEVPPEERPKGAQFAWIPGYWSWDADRNGYIWVSACWRAVPPKMAWVPGYWVQVSEGWEWIAGYWAPAGDREIVYLPTPPVVEEFEPVEVQPSPDVIWVPPCMYWSGGQYIRRNGYWLAAQPNWVWVPSHYIMTPRGCIFVEGHWDYSLERRGVLFAPVYFPVSVYRRVAFTYSPRIVIDIGLLRVSLFACPRYSHYYFGDYYDGAYLNIGIYPWFESRRYHTWYDPVYEHSRWRHHHSEPHWEDHERDEYRRRRDDKNLRPAHTFREQESRLSSLPEPQRRTLRTVRPIEGVVTDKKGPLKFERIGPDARQKISRQAADVRKFGHDRNLRESPPFDSGKIRPPEDRKPVGIPPERKPANRPDEHRKPQVVPPVTEPRKPIQPVERPKPPVKPHVVRPPERNENPGTKPDSRREPVPPRKTRVSTPERVQVPAAPVAGKSGWPGLFKKNPPSRPASEFKNDKKQDLRRK